MNKIIRNTFVVLFILILLLSSCKVTKNLEKYDLCSYKVKNIIKKTVSNNIFESSIKIPKIAVKYNDGNNNITLNGWLKSSNDSIVVISLTANFGIEVARVYILNGEIYVINRMEKEVYRYNSRSIQTKLGFNFNVSDFEDIITGSFPNTLNNDKKTWIDGKCDEEFNLYRIGYDIEEYHFIYIINNDFVVKKIRAVNLAEDKVLSMEYIREENKLKEIKINASTSKKKYSIDLKINKIVDIEDENVELKLPEKYSIIDL